MTTTDDPDPASAAPPPPEFAAVLDQLERAWNAADGTAFAEAFWPDADFTVWDGFQLDRTDAIARDHTWAFTDGPRAGSTARFVLTRVRSLTPDVAILHSLATITDSGGTGEQTLAVPRGVVHRRDGQWRFVSFTNVLFRPVPPAHHPDNRSAPQPADRPAPARSDA